MMRSLKKVIDIFRSLFRFLARKNAYITYGYNEDLIFLSSYVVIDNDFAYVILSTLELQMYSFNGFYLIQLKK